MKKFFAGVFVGFILFSIFSTSNNAPQKQPSSAYPPTYIEKNLLPSSDDEEVAFNEKTHKVHKLDCPAAQKCTVNCVNVTRKEAYDRGGVPCGICGG